MTELGHNHFQQLQPTITEVIVTKHFRRDAPDFDVKLVADSEHSCFTHLHKYEETIEGNHIFRALQHKTHFVYCVDTENRLICLRAFPNFKEYKKFLEDKKAILRMIGSV